MNTVMWKKERFFVCQRDQERDIHYTTINKYDITRCYKICTCSVILEEYDSITSRLLDLGIIFPNTFFRCNLMYKEGLERIFLFPPSITFQS